MKKDDEDFTLAQVEVYITRLNDFLNIPRKMTGTQSMETARLIVQEFYYMNLADIKLAFDKIKTGSFGNLYEGIDGVKIITAIREYEMERAGYAEYVSHNTAVENKKDELAVPIPVEVAEQIKKAFAPKPKQDTPVDTRQMEIKKLSDEYRKKWIDWRVDNPGANRYLFEKEYMSVEEYIKTNFKDESD